MTLSVTLEGRRLVVCEHYRCERENTGEAYVDQNDCCVTGLYFEGDSLQFIFLLNIILILQTNE